MTVVGNGVFARFLHLVMMLLAPFTFSALSAGLLLLSTIGKMKKNVIMYLPTYATPLAPLPKKCMLLYSSGARDQKCAKTRCAMYVQCMKIENVQKPDVWCWNTLIFLKSVELRSLKVDRIFNIVKDLKDAVFFYSVYLVLYWFDIVSSILVMHIFLIMSRDWLVDLLDCIVLRSK
jgi:hypothetical protein